MSKMRMQAKVKDGVTEIKVIIPHPMETGQRKDASSGQLIPAHFIQELTFEHAGKVVMNSMWSGGVSKNPYLGFKFKGGKAGDMVKMMWKDNKGESDTLEVEIKE